MRKWYTIGLFLFAVIAKGQSFNTLTLKKTFNSEEELAKAYPQLIKPKLILETTSIKVLDNKNALKKQVSRTTVPSNLNSFVFSPLQDFFVGFEETEVQSKDLYFYRSDGTFLAKQSINIYPNVKFSNNGEYVIAFNHFGREILVFDKMGSLIFSGDYIKMINDKSKILDNVFVSENAGEIILNAGNDIYFFNTKTKKEIFRAPIGGWTLDGNFYSTKGAVGLKVRPSGPANRKYVFKMISKLDGKVLDEVSNLDQIEFTSSGIVVLKDSNILEYAFKK